RALALAGRRRLRRVRPRQAVYVIVRWGLSQLAELLRELGIERPFLIASERWSKLDLPASGPWSEVPSDRIDEIAAATGDADGLPFEGARTIDEALPQVAGFLDDRKARGRLLAGADAAGHALALAGLGLGHAMAQAIGGRYGLPHGALNAICLPAALRFNEPVAGAEIARFGEALKTEDPVARVRELAQLGGFVRL